MLNASQRRVNKNSLTWWYVLKMSWRRFSRRLEDIFKTSSKRLEDLFARRLEDVLKTSWRRLENLLKTSWQDVLKTSWRRIAKTNILVLTKTSSEDVRLRRTYSSWSRRLEDVFQRRRRKTSSRRLQDILIKTNVCWDATFLPSVWNFLFTSLTRSSNKTLAQMKYPSSSFFVIDIYRKVS